MRWKGEESNNGHYYTEFYDIQENTVIEVNDSKISKKDKIPHGKVKQEHAKAVIYQVQLPSNDKEQLKIDQPIGIQKLLNKPKQGNNKGQQRDSSTGLT